MIGWTFSIDTLNKSPSIEFHNLLGSGYKSLLFEAYSNYLSTASSTIFIYHNLILAVLYILFL